MSVGGTGLSENGRYVDRQRPRLCLGSWVIYCLAAVVGGAHGRRARVKVP